MDDLPPSTSECSILPIARLYGAGSFVCCPYLPPPHHLRAGVWNSPRPASCDVTQDAIEKLKLLSDLHEDVFPEEQPATEPSETE